MTFDFNFWVFEPLSYLFSMAFGFCLALLYNIEYNNKKIEYINPQGVKIILSEKEYILKQKVKDAIDKVCDDWCKTINGVRYDFNHIQVLKDLKKELFGDEQ
jgi:hypothetical protein